MEKDAAFAAEPPDLFNGLEHAGFIVRRHDGDQDGLWRKRVFESVKINQTVRFYGKPGNAITVLLQIFAAIKNSLVLAHSSNDVVATRALGLSDAEDSEVVAFSGAGGKNNLLRRRADCSGDLTAGRFHSRSSFPSKRMAIAGGIAKFGSEERQHGL